MSKRPVQAGIDQVRWLDKSEAMRWTHRLTEATFDRDFKDATIYDGGKCHLWDKEELDRLIKRRMVLFPGGGIK